MNTPKQQAELYRKAAETIEMCAEHGIEAKIKMCGIFYFVTSCSMNGNYDAYEFPLAVVEGRLVWKGDEIYFKGTGCAVTAGEHNFPLVDHNYTLTPPKRTVMVELLVEDAEKLRFYEYNNRISNAIGVALNNLKGSEHNNLRGLHGTSDN